MFEKNSETSQTLNLNLLHAEHNESMQMMSACSLLMFHRFSVSLLHLLFELLALWAPFVAVGEKKKRNPKKQPLKGKGDL